MRKGLFVLLFVLVNINLFAQKGIVYASENGIFKENNIFKLGGGLNRSTTIDGNLKSFHLTNLDTFFVDGRLIYIKNTAKKLLLSSNDSVNVTGQNILLHAAQGLNLHGFVRFEGYNNNATMDSLLTVDEVGNLRLVAKELPQPITTNYKAENGLTLENNKLIFGGSLNRSTAISGNYQSLRFTNLDTFFLGGRHIQFLNSTKSTTISSFDSLRLQSLNSLLLSANKVTVDGLVNFTNYKNSVKMDSILTVDSCGNLKLVSQSSLQTMAQNAFMNHGNTFGAPAYFGTNDKNFLNFKTNNVVRGNIDTNGVFNYNYGVAVNNSKFKTTGDIEINGIQPYATTEYQKASKGINFVAGTESLARGTISFNSSLASMNYTSLGALRFFTAVGGVPYNNLVADLLIKEGVFRFGGRNSISQADEASAAYQFKDHYDGLGLPRGIMFPRVGSTVVRNYQKAPAIGLMFYNQETNDIEIYKPDGWHKIQTVNLTAPAPTQSIAQTIESPVANSNSYVQALGDGQQKSFMVAHNLNARFVMVQFIDCGPEANCNLLQILPKGSTVELDGKNTAVITFNEAPSFQRYKVMFLRVQ